MTAGQHYYPNHHQTNPLTDRQTNESAISYSNSNSNLQNSSTYNNRSTKSHNINGNNTPSNLATSTNLVVNEEQRNKANYNDNLENYNDNYKMTKPIESNGGVQQQHHTNYQFKSFTNTHQQNAIQNSHEHKSGILINSTTKSILHNEADHVRLSSKGVGGALDMNGDHKNHHRVRHRDEEFTEIRYYDEDDNEHVEDYEEDEEDLSSEALLAVGSAEEYAAKIIKLQQACLIPLKEDLAEWLNKILNTSNITTDNFMDKLDNGVIICRLAKIISHWCEQQLAASTNNLNNDAHSPVMINNHKIANTENLGPQLQQLDQATGKQTHKNKGNNGILNSNIQQVNVASHNLSASHGNASLRSVSRSTNCLTSSASANSTPVRCSMMLMNNNGYSYSNQFINNLIKMDQTKIWEYAKCRTFYARDNVCNFIKWSKEFGVNQSVLFESDDLVLHANPRQVVLCILDVARIAYVKYGFTEAPGLVKFEQEIDRELEAEKALLEAAKRGDQRPLPSDRNGKQLRSQPGDEYSNAGDDPLGANDNRLGRPRDSRGASIGDATDALIMRYCKHKEEEAARKKNEELMKAAAEAAAAAEEAQRLRVAELEATAALAAQEAKQRELNEAAALITSTTTAAVIINNSDTTASSNNQLFENDSLMTCVDKECEDEVINSTTTKTIRTNQQSQQDDRQADNLFLDCRVDSLDSGEGQTESVSTSQSHTPSIPLRKHSAHSIIPRLTPAKFQNGSSVALASSQQRASSTTTTTTTTTTNSGLSSSRSSLLSAHGDGDGNGVSSGNVTPKRQITSDLDGKVMRIAKSYYGKGVSKGVTRLSEGKYKIADRIVFVRLLKGHRVMVRIGGGWDTLENFLFRHKSDPSQVIDVDNLLPLETKMANFVDPKSSTNNLSSTPSSSSNGHHHHHKLQIQSHHKSSSKLPYYRRSNSASTTNLSLTNLSTTTPVTTPATTPTSNRRPSRFHLYHADRKHV